MKKKAKTTPSKAKTKTYMFGAKLTFTCNPSLYVEVFAKNPKEALKKARRELKAVMKDMDEDDLLKYVEDEIWESGEVVRKRTIPTYFGRAAQYHTPDTCQICKKHDSPDNFLPKEDEELW